LTLIILSLFQGTVLTHQQEIVTLSSTYWGNPTAETSNAWPVLMSWIEDNTAQNARIFTPYQREVALHTEREAIWDTRIWFVDDADDTLKYMDDLFQTDYVLIKSTLIRSEDTYSNPMHIPENSTLYRLFQISTEFELVYQYQDFLIYKRTPSL